MLLDFLSSLRPLYRDSEICLVLNREDVRDPALGIDDGYTFDMGHIGYRIDAPYRGHGYAARACEMLIPFMRELQLKSVCITANPDNTPSRKTCERIGCVLESIVAVPPAYRAVCSGAEYKCRYILLPGGKA